MWPRGHMWADEPSYDKNNPQHFYNVLLLALIVVTFAVDTSICERGFLTMLNEPAEDGQAL